jgi:molecular chaperone HscA
LREEQVEAERILLATQSALDADAALLSDEERADIARLIESLRVTVQGSDHQAIKDAVEALARGTEDFAARRMDRSVRAALAGRKLDEIA